MYLYSCRILTTHGNVRTYEVVACSMEAATREAKEYGRVTVVIRLRPITLH